MHQRGPEHLPLLSYGCLKHSVTHPRIILVIEDNPGDIRLIKESLREFGDQVDLQVVMDGDDALKYLNRQVPFDNAPRPNLIFLDLNLPKGTSKDVLRHIKDDRTFRNIPVAVLTSSDADRDVREAYELHANCYLRKPVDLDTFMSTIRSTVKFWMGVASIPADRSSL
jgi:chemotaxis family two-component system response regulator Rcp1